MAGTSSLRAPGGFLVEEATGRDVWEFWGETIQDHLTWLRDRHWNGWPNWVAAYNLARGAQWSEEIKKDDSLSSQSDLVDDLCTVPKISTHVEDMIGFLSRTDPYFVLQPRREIDVESAEAQEAYLNYTWRELGFRQPLKRFLRDFATIGHGILRTGYVPAHEVVDSQGRQGGVQHQTRYEDSFRADVPSLRRVNPFRFFYDRFAPDGALENARWCAELFWRPLQDVVADKNYNQTSTIRKIRQGVLTPQTLDSFRVENNDRRRDPGAEDLGVFVQVWDKRYRIVRIFPLGMVEPIDERAWPYPYLDGFPFIKADFVPVPNEPYGLGHAHLAAHSQLLLNRLRTKMAQHVRKHNSGIATIGDEVPEAAKRILENDESGKHVSLPSGTSISPIPVPQMGTDLFNVAGIVEADLRDLMREDQLASGEGLPGRTSAEEIRTRTRMFGMKLQDLIDTVDETVRAAGRQVLQHIKANTTTERAIQVVGRQGTQWRTLTTEDIQAEVDVDVESTTREPVDKATERQQITQAVMQTIQAMPQIFQAIQVQAQMGLKPSVPNVNFSELFRALAESFDSKALERAFPDTAVEPSPLAVQWATTSPQAQAIGTAPPAQGPQDASQSAAQQSRPTAIGAGEQ